MKKLNLKNLVIYLDNPASLMVAFKTPVLPTTIIIDKNGMIHAPKGPGIGYETLWAEKGAPKELAKFLKG